MFVIRTWCGSVTWFRSAVGNISDIIHKSRCTNANCRRDRALAAFLHGPHRHSALPCHSPPPGHSGIWGRTRRAAMRAPRTREPMQIERKRKPAPASRNAIVKSFARGLQVVKTLAEGHAPLTIAEVAERAQLTRAGARRLLLTLQELGYVALRGRHFSLTPRIMELRCSYSTSAPIWMAVEEHLGELVDDINETASAGMLDDLDIVYVLRLRTPRAIHLDIESGSRLPAHITSIGRVLLA